MTTFDFTYVIDDVQDSEIISKALCWTTEVYSVELTVNYDISKYYPSTWNDPEEGGELEDCECNVYFVNDTIPVTEKQSKIIIDCLDYDYIVEKIWDHHDDQRLNDD